MHLDDYNCAVCSLASEETLLHLFLDCQFVVECWGTLGLVIHNSADPFDTITSFRAQLGVPFSMEIIISMSWAIWSVRNDAIFRNVQPQISHAKYHFRRDFAQVILRGKANLAPLFSQWLEANV